MVALWEGGEGSGRGTTGTRRTLLAASEKKDNDPCVTTQDPHRTTMAQRMMMATQQHHSPPPMAVQSTTMSWRPQQQDEEAWSSGEQRTRLLEVELAQVRAELEEERAQREASLARQQDQDKMQMPQLLLQHAEETPQAPAPLLPAVGQRQTESKGEVTSGSRISAAAASRSSVPVAKAGLAGPEEPGPSSAAVTLKPLAPRRSAGGTGAVDAAVDSGFLPQSSLGGNTAAQASVGVTPSAVTGGIPRRMALAGRPNEKERLSGNERTVTMRGQRPLPEGCRLWPIWGILLS